ncbi:fatty acid synthase beta subunit [Whalleya microplaca]|nr:fatty acid synthase beta subunit [Whalleya microplaca]
MIDLDDSDTGPGIFTPEPETGSQPLSIIHKAHEYTFTIPSFVYGSATRLRDKFLRTLVNSTDQDSENDGSLSTIELVSRFLGFIVKEIEIEVDAGSDLEVLELVLRQFERDLLHNEEVHAVVSRLPNDIDQLMIIQSYYLALGTIRRPATAPESALMHAALEGTARVYAVFGGQGNTKTYLDELRDVYTTYPSLIKRFLLPAARYLQRLSRDARASQAFSHGLDVMKWLEEPDSQPDSDYLTSAPISFPLIGLMQILHYVVITCVLGTHPGYMRDRLAGTTGHSQGIILAAAIAASTDWESFEVQGKKALTILFWIGVRSQEAYPLPSIAPKALEDSVEHGEGEPTAALSIRGMSREDLDKYIGVTNRALPGDRQIVVALVNGAKNFVVTGPPMALYGLNVQFRRVKAPENVDESRILFSQRKLHITNRFLPITAPFHSPYLVGAVQALQEDLKDTTIFTSDLSIPLYSTFSGRDIRSELPENSDIVPSLVRMVCQDRVHWDKVIAMPDATHILDFGPGRTAGVAGLTSRIKDGTGVRVILATNITNPVSAEIGCKHEIFTRFPENLEYGVNWAEQYGPKLIRTSAGETLVDTKMSRLLGLPPVMVAGMTPTTVHWDFVAAATNAGYEVELACGGYYDGRSLSEAIAKIENAIPPGRGITLNLIYANPRAIAWQIPLIRSLCTQGLPISGITIGAGVPSLEIASEYIQLGIKRIGFKPGSVHAINQVIKIAQANPGFPVILQWTGGRGGGHHSCEDFHEPILTLYSRIRRCKNIVLVAGSGFGSADDTYPYLNGTWATKLGYPAMPFDGILLGSHCMVAKEAHTSKNAKQAIVDARGLDNNEWEKTYQKPAGGGSIITVRSEMGEPIHKLATRGVIFWAEMDQKLFSLPKEKRLLELKKPGMRDYIIRRLDADFQKPWFGRTASGKSVDLGEMTYGEVISRMVELMFIKHQKRWIDASLARLTGDFMRHVEQRLATYAKIEIHSLVKTYEALDNPFPFVDSFLAAYPLATTQLMNTQDCTSFLRLCKRPGQKPVPFVPCLDEDFEVWFKKDSLWQSEDLDAVIDQDVGRVCILQGPVAVKYSTTTEESIKQILDRVHEGHIQMLTNDLFGGEEANIPIHEYLGDMKMDDSLATSPALEGVAISMTDDKTSLLIPDISEITLPGQDLWMRLLAGKRATWRRAFFTADVIIQGHRFEVNPLHRLFAPSRGMLVEIEYPDDPAKTILTVNETINDKQFTTMKIGPITDNVIPMHLLEHRTVLDKPVALPLIFTYHPEAGYAPIREDMTSRNERIKDFYYNIWFGNRHVDHSETVLSTGRFDGGTASVSSAMIREFARAVDNHAEAYIDRSGRDVLAPMDFAIVIGWKALLKPLLYAIDGDLLKLVHLSNRFRMVPGAALFRKGDSLSTSSEITAVVNRDSGQMVEVCGTITRDDGRPMMQVTSQFFYRGSYANFDKTFQRKVEERFRVLLKTAKDVAILKAKKWFKLEKSDTELLGNSIVFKLQTSTKFSDKVVFASVETFGTVEMEVPSTKELICIASVSYTTDGPSRGNPVLEYLRRTGSQLEQPVYFKHPIPIESISRAPLTIDTPASNENYARVSGDFNPVHVSRVFSQYVNLPGTITHGMWTSAAVRSLVETWVTENNVNRMRDFYAEFIGMVLPGDRLEVQLHHVGMVSGCKIIQIEVTKADDTKDKVLVGEAIIEQPTSAYIFTGQGSQEQGMGMELYEKSAIARDVWDRADRHFLDTFGFSILDIVRNDPKELTVYFGGARGKAIRQNYIEMTCQSLELAADGSAKLEKVFKGITEETTFYTFRSPAGLLSATQFTQPALTLMQMAAFEDLRAEGVIQKNSVFAGHSLGEYSALASIAKVMPVETLVSVVFYRGLCMQVAVERNEAGQSNYSMCAVDPSRIGRNFSEQALKHVVETISTVTGAFLEIVNFNVRNMQYVCAGDLSGLDVLAGVLDSIKTYGVSVQSLEVERHQLVKIIEEMNQRTQAKPEPLELSRGLATVPLRGIDVPFHSTYLRSGVQSFRSFLLKNLEKSSIDPEQLIGKYIPNVTARPFELTRESFEYVYEMTKSPRISKVLEGWNKYEASWED